MQNGRKIRRLRPKKPSPKEWTCAGDVEEDVEKEKIARIEKEILGKRARRRFVNDFKMDLRFQSSGGFLQLCASA